LGEREVTALVHLFRSICAKLKGGAVKAKKAEDKYLREGRPPAAGLLSGTEGGHLENALRD